MTTTRRAALVASTGLWHWAAFTAAYVVPPLGAVVAFHGFMWGSVAINVGTAAAERALRVPRTVRTLMGVP